MSFVIALVALAAVAQPCLGHAQPQPLAQPLAQPQPQPQQYPPPPYGQPGGIPPPGGYPGAPLPGQPGYTGVGGVGGSGYNASYLGASPYGPANGVPGYPGSNDMFRPVYEWFKLDFAWPDENLKAAALRASQYIPENNALAGIKVWRDRMFLSVPRWKEGVPATLTSVPAQPRGGSNAPRLEPFPSWEWQEQGNCSALQNVHGFEIDNEGRMWVLDSGRVNTRGRNQENRCPPKLVIFDLNTAQFTDNYYNNGYNMNSGSSIPGSPGYPGPGGAFNDPNRPYGSNQPYGSGNQPYDPNRPYNPNNPNQPYDPNRPYNPSNPNQPYNPSQPYSSNPSDPHYRPSQYSSNPADPNYRPYSSNPSDPNYRDPNYRSGYDNNYNDPYNHNNQYGGGFGSNNPLYRNSPNRGIRVIKSYTFPEEAAQRTSALLSNIVLDSNDGWYAYITDSSDPDPGIIVFSLAQSRSWKVRDSRSMRADPRTDSVTINGDRAEIQVNVAGIALSPMARERMVYYSPLSSMRMYSLPTSVLREPGRDIGGSVNDLGQKTSVTDGMIMDSNGALYFGLLGETGISRWDSHRDNFAAARSMARDPRLLQWPDTFAIDQTGNLLVVTNKLQNFLRNRPMDHEPTYRVLRAALGVQSYISGGGAGFGTAYKPSVGITGSFGADAYGGAGYDPYNEPPQDLSRAKRAANPLAQSPQNPVYPYDTARGSPCVGIGQVRPDGPCDDAHRFLSDLSKSSRQTWDAVRRAWVPNPNGPGSSSGSAYQAMPAPGGGYFPQASSAYNPPYGAAGSSFGYAGVGGPGGQWDGVSASVSSSGDTVVRRYHGGSNYLDDPNSNQYDPNFKQPTSYDVDGRNYDDPGNNPYDSVYKQPSSFDPYGGGVGGGYGNQYGSRGYYGRYNAATATTAPLTLVATLLAAVLALGVLADRR